MRSPDVPDFLCYPLPLFLSRFVVFLPFSLNMLQEKVYSLFFLFHLLWWDTVVGQNGPFFCPLVSLSTTRAVPLPRGLTVFVLAPLPRFPEERRFDQVRSGSKLLAPLSFFQFSRDITQVPCPGLTTRLPICFWFLARPKNHSFFFFFKVFLFAALKVVFLTLVT